MKLTIRVVALVVVFVGVAAASVTSSASHKTITHQSATASNPIPMCAPGLPGCPNTPNGQ